MFHKALVLMKWEIGKLIGAEGTSVGSWENMPHRINIDGITESLFLLQNLVHASRSFCSANKITGTSNAEGEFDFDYYSGWLKLMACENLIQVSVRLRILEDIVKADGDSVDFSVLDGEARKDIILGNCAEASTENITLREAWNKIIHATETQLDWKAENGFEFWTGDVLLSGNKYGSGWKLVLHVKPFVIASTRFLDHLEQTVDFHHLYKYDR